MDLEFIQLLCAVLDGGYKISLIHYFLLVLWKTLRGLRGVSGKVIERDQKGESLKVSWAHCEEHQELRSHYLP